MKGDVVKLTFPAKPDYILAVRLAVSAIAERVGFTVDDIEDIKVASAEGCILLLSVCPESIDIVITIEDGIRMDFCALKPTQSAERDDEINELSQYLLEALVDNCEFIKQDGILTSISFYKKL